MFYFSFVSHVRGSDLKLEQICFVSVLFQFHFRCTSGLSGSIVGRLNEVTVTVRQAGLVLRWLTVHGYTVLVFNQAIQANSTFHPSGVDKSSTGLLGWGEGGARSPVSASFFLQKM